MNTNGLQTVDVERLLDSDDNRLPPSSLRTNQSANGTWRSTICNREGTFYVLTPPVFDDQPETNNSRWDIMVFTSANLSASVAWSQPVHLNFTSYDTSPFWDANGTTTLDLAMDADGGPYEVNPANPILTNASTSNYF
ncbi:glycoside hydrolase family 43 protein [Daedalea quercina L-15889]|uniref:Glycoside hydrolase family 43 protein n=1 Tax=Daedalea quercina L-15889 TaxID=1314783 RepID=A0A165SBP4_9APHY|nr:glycoside hydrolase family 43 protein [Daedalea quercina L-15889]